MADKRIAVADYQVNGVWESKSWNSGSDSAVDPDGNPIGGAGAGSFSSGIEVTVGSKDSGDTIAECHFLHENGVFDGIEAAIQVIRDFGGTNKCGTIYVRRGTYISQARYYLTDVKITIQGSGREYTTLQQGASVSEYQFQMYNPSACFKDITFTSHTASPTYNYMFISSSCRNANFHRCRFKGYQSSTSIAILGDTSNNVVVLEDCIFEFYNGGDRAILAAGSKTKLYMSRCVFYTRTSSTYHLFLFGDLNSVYFDYCRIEQPVGSNQLLISASDVSRFVVKDSYIKHSLSNGEDSIFIHVNTGFSSSILIKDNNFESYSRSITIDTDTQDDSATDISGNIWTIPSVSSIPALAINNFYYFLRPGPNANIIHNRFYPKSYDSNHLVNTFRNVYMDVGSSFEKNTIEAIGDGSNLIQQWYGVYLSEDCEACENIILLSGTGITKAVGINCDFEDSIICNNFMSIKADTDGGALSVFGIKAINSSGHYRRTIDYNVIIITNTAGSVANTAVGIFVGNSKFSVNDNYVRPHQLNDTGIYVDPTGNPSGVVIGNSIETEGAGIFNTSPNVIVANNDLA